MTREVEMGFIVNSAMMLGICSGWILLLCLSDAVTPKLEKRNR